MAEADECIICLQTVNTSPHYYDTYTIMQTCCCLYVAHPRCIAEWVVSRGSCIICHKPAAVGYRNSVLQEMRSDVQSPIPEDTLDNHRHNPIQTRSDTKCCTIL